MKRYIALGLFLIGGLMAAGTARAVETQAGDACTAGQAGWVRYSGGPEQSPPQQIRCNGSTWVALLGVSSNLSETIAIDDLKDGISNPASGTLYLGSGSGLVSTGSSNTAIGIQSLANNTTGAGNIAIGPKALMNNISGVNNTAIGNVVLSSNTTGNNNFAIGNSALTMNTTGNQNFAMGIFALGQNTTGLQNLALGAFALGANSTGTQNLGLGTNSLMHNVTGSRNVAVGHFAAKGTNSSITTDTVVIGSYAGYVLSNSQQNTLIGGYAGQTITTGSNNIVIGYNANTPSATTNNYINIGNTIYGDSSLQMMGIGKGPAVALDVSGDINYTGTIADISDRRLKTAIKPWQGSALEKLALMKPITFEMKNRRGITEYGFVAQEVQPIFPELVQTAHDASRTLSMNYVGMVAPMVKAIQELKCENDRMRRQLEQICTVTKACH